jgi:glycosyltransferase involved in cell wall biosynthesis
MVGCQEKGFASDIACGKSISPFHNLEKRVIEGGHTYFTIDHFRQPIAPLHDFLALIELVSLLRKNKFTIVHTHNSKAGFIGRLAAWLAKVPIIVHTVHGFSFHSAESKIRRTVFIFLERLAAKITHHMIFISEPLISLAREKKILKGKKPAVHKIFSCIDFSRFDWEKTIAADLRREYGLPCDAKIVACISKLWPGKGHAFLLEAFKQVATELKNVFLFFVGEGDLEAHLKHLATKNDLTQKIIFTQFREDIPQITKAIDLSILVSDFEGMGRILLEAMAMKKPVIATRVGGMVELVDDGVNGILVEPGNRLQLATAMTQILSDPTLARNMGEHGFSKVRSGPFHVDTMIGAIAGVYERALHEHGQLK